MYRYLMNILVYNVTRDEYGISFQGGIYSHLSSAPQDLIFFPMGCRIKYDLFVSRVIRLEVRWYFAMVRILKMLWI